MKTFTQTLDISLKRNVKANFDAVNYGGCGYFARYLTHYLNKKGISHEIKAHYVGHELDHIMVEIKNRLFDGEGDVTAVEKTNCKLKQDALVQMVMCDSDWNPVFINRNSRRGSVAKWKIINHLRKQIKKAVDEAINECDVK